MPGQDDSMPEAPLEGMPVGKYFLRKRSKDTAQAATETSSRSPHDSRDSNDPAAVESGPSAISSEVVRYAAGEAEAPPAVFRLEEFLEEHASEGTAEAREVQSASEAAVCSEPASLGNDAAAPADQKTGSQSLAEAPALAAAESALRQAEEAKAALQAQLDDFQSREHGEMEMAERLQGLQEELEERDSKIAESKALASAKTQELRNERIQGDMAKATLLEALREGQERAAASIRPTARELHHVGQDGSLLQIITKFAGLYVALQERYVDEAAQRRRLHNALVDMKGAIRVFARLRPALPHEAGLPLAIECDSMGAVVDATTRMSGRAGGSRHCRFEYDTVFGPASTQDDIYAEAAPVITSVLDGYHVCMFAYGQTASGKTHTMQGARDDPGVNFRALDDLFRLVAARSPEADYEIHVSLTEVYLEKIRDLLNSSSAPNLEVKHNAFGSYLPGLVEKKVTSASEAQHWLSVGLAARASAETAMNTRSSRSHCLLCIRTTGRSRLTGDVWRAKLWLVDLAGSERLDKATVDRGPDASKRLAEAQFINKSLASLGDCIHALAVRAPHVPFRNSKLTYMLQDSLAGGSKTVMFANVAPCERDAGESVCSLNFAARVRGVELGAVRKNIDAAADVRLLQAQVAAQQSQMAEMAVEQERLQSELRALRLAAPPAAPSPLAKPSAGPSPLADKARSTKLAHGSPAQRRRSPQRKASLPTKPSWNTGVGSSAVGGPGVKGHMRPPPPRVAPLPKGAASAFQTPRSARHRTPRSAIRGLVDKTLRRVSNATGMAKTSAQAIMRNTSKIPQSALKGAKHPLTQKPPMAATSSSSLAGVPSLPMGVPRAEPPSDRIAAVHAPVRPSHSLPPPGPLKAEEAKEPAPAPTMGATGVSGARPPMVPRLNLPPMFPLPSSANSTPRDSQRELSSREDDLATTLAPKTGPQHDKLVSPDENSASLAKFMAYYQSQGPRQSISHTATGGKEGAARQSIAGPARVRAQVPKTPAPALWARADRTPMPARHASQS
ncbi:hypothetical protein WJX73_009180 [Symbiochloris irregularis]|uniref:Kinesin motor domain-containing protein n=1 Tax=Symbiochloris irregularis TaxID=706552 RepID=A0AAW1P067_9CHLO